MRDFKNLEVWKEAHQIAKECYKVSSYFPQEEKFGLTSQLRRSSLSIPTNLAEGCGRGSQKDLKRFCDIAMGSASEVEYLLFFINEIGILQYQDYKSLSESLITMKKRLNALIQKLKSNVQ
ncbi:four helix bundle protein [Ekhidna sp.]|uniref:four helix bundle protein n=1 Tax=Ekhidna sp. TaxID=2608089 RepID=UPI003B5C67F3